MPSHRAHCSTACTDRLQNQPRHYHTRVQSNLWDRNTSEWGEKNIRKTNSQITLQPSAPSQRHRKSLNLPLTCQTDKRCFHPASWFLFKCTMEEAKSVAVAPLQCYDLSRLHRVPVCGRQLSLKLVTVQPPTCQLNGLFICPRAMHYGPEQSLLMALSLFHFPWTHMKKIV